MGLGIRNGIKWARTSGGGGINDDVFWTTEDFVFLIASEDGENILKELTEGFTEFILLENGGRVLGEQNSLNMIKE